MRFKPPLIVVHGGAGSFRLGWEERREKYLKGLRDAVMEGYRALIGGSALDAVEAAVALMEDNEAFNAGYGSSLTLKGEVEMDAGIMDGGTLRAGAVAYVRNIKNPIVLARKVMELTDHVLLVGAGAEAFGASVGVETSTNMIPKGHVDRYRRALEEWRSGRGFRHLSRLRELVAKYPKLLDLDTVGAVALDRDGNVAAATSTGGIWLKMPGRVGDSPIPGAGFYADNSGGAASATGIGEYIIMTRLCSRAVELMCQGVTASTAAKAAIDVITERYGRGTAGIITVDIKGNVGIEYNTAGMGRGIMASDLDSPIVRVFRE